MRADYPDAKTGEPRDFGRADVKHRLVGHWGTTPGINFLFAHVNRLIADHGQNTIFLMGPGHGRPGRHRAEPARRHLPRDSPRHHR